MELCDRNCNKCTAKEYSGHPTGCKIMNSMIKANEMKQEAYRSMKSYWDNKSR